MATFRVGQRVRLVCSHPDSFNPIPLERLPIGSEGIVVGFQNAPNGTVTRGGAVYGFDSNIIVDWGFGGLGSNTEYLEPILPQHEPCEEWFRSCDLDALLGREASHV